VKDNGGYNSMKEKETKKEAIRYYVRIIINDIK
jgi:hypothetical protein